MKLKKIDTSTLLGVLRTFTYTTIVNGSEVTVNAELFPDSMTSTINALFIQRYGNLKCDDIAEAYYKEEITAANLGATLKVILSQKWKHYLEMWKSQYNPIWNVDGTEVRTITTQYGKITTVDHDTTLTDEQVTDGKNNTTHGLVTTITEPTTTNSVATFDSADYVGAGQSSATEHTNTDSGTTNIAISTGKSTHDMDGTDTTTDSGSDTVTDTFVRGGNIGTTMTQALLESEGSFWQKMDFFNMWYDSIAQELTVPIYEWGDDV